MYPTDLRELSHTIQPFHSLSPHARDQLELLGQAEALPVRWDDFGSLKLSRGLFQDSFVGLAELGGKISRMASICVCVV